MSKNYLKLALASLVMLIVFWGLIAVLGGCASAPPVKLGQQYVHPATALAVGKNANFEWNCVRSETTDKLYGINCTFHNISNSVGEKEMCLKASVFTGVTHELVAASPVVCSGLIYEDGVSNTFIYFQRRARKEMLVICGLDNSFCKLNITEEKR